MVYEHTPEWPYYDLRKRAEFTGWESSSYHFELAAIQEEYETDGWKERPPQWFKREDITREGVLPHDVWEAIDEAIDEKCKAEDAERRRAASIADRAAVSPRSKRKH